MNKNQFSKKNVHLLGTFVNSIRNCVKNVIDQVYKGTFKKIFLPLTLSQNKGKSPQRIKAIPLKSTVSMWLANVSLYSIYTVSHDLQIIFLVFHNSFRIANLLVASPTLSFPNIDNNVLPVYNTFTQGVQRVDLCESMAPFFLLGNKKMKSIDLHYCPALISNDFALQSKLPQCTCKTRA